MNLREFIQSEIKSQLSESVNEAKKPHTIVVMDNGERLAVDNKDIPRLKSGKEVVGNSLKYAGQEAWVYPQLVKKIEESVNESVNEMKLRNKKGVELTYDQAMSTIELDKEIESYIRDNYPEDYNPGVSRWHGGGKVGMTGKQGHGLSVTHIMNIAKFAKKNNDKELSKLIGLWIVTGKRLTPGL